MCVCVCVCVCVTEREGDRDGERFDCDGGRRDLLGPSFEVLLMAMIRRWINVCV